ncbi:MAG: hypothetical protein A2Z38_02015 [Planctomycetes bacterium RBG_19FT_COMBO_48_8]|nr:MAG: hypothetical protein A2Z38_02015 [Planctomycetes bacterium RBG_19FT_COMBO_48_8]
MRLNNLYNVVQMQIHTAIVLILILSSPVISFCAETNTSTKSSPAYIVPRTTADGKIVYKLITPDELKALLGHVVNKAVRNTQHK